MLIGTHALSPVVASYFGSNFIKRTLSIKELLLVAFIGAAPDLLNPHISLESRHSSWSHSFVGFCLIIGLLFTLTLFIKKLRWRVSLWCSFAYFWHLVCDWFAGGIPYLYPIKKDIIGDYWLPPIYWLFSDAIFILLSFAILLYERNTSKIRV